MPVTTSPVRGVTSDLRRAPMDPGRFRSGRWLVLVEGLVVGAFGVAGLVSAAQHPDAGPTGAPVLGLATTPAHSAMLLAFGLAAVAAVGKRRAAVTVTGLSAVAYLLLLFAGSVATARATPTPLGFHAADIVLHGVLGVINLALLMWLVPDELGDEPWVRRRGRHRERHDAPAADKAVTNPMTEFPAGAAPAPKPAPPPTAAPESGPDRNTTADRTLPGQSKNQVLKSNSESNVERPARPKSFPARVTDAVLSGGVVPVAVAALVAVVGIVIWMRRR